MKLFTRLGIYKNSSGTLTFNPETKEAFSYEWYQLVGEFKGKVFLNKFRYSRTTGKHVQEIRSLLKELGISFIAIEASHGLQALRNPKNTTSEYNAESEIKRIELKIESLNKKILNARSISICAIYCDQVKELNETIKIIKKYFNK